MVAMKEIVKEYRHIWKRGLHLAWIQTVGLESPHRFLFDLLGGIKIGNKPSHSFSWTGKRCAAVRTASCQSLRRHGTRQQELRMRHSELGLHFPRPLPRFPARALSKETRLRDGGGQGAGNSRGGQFDGSAHPVLARPVFLFLEHGE